MKSTTILGQEQSIVNSVVVTILSFDDSVLQYSLTGGRSRRPTRNRRLHAWLDCSS